MANAGFNLLGQDDYQYQPFQLDSSAIIGDPSVGPQYNYGLNDVYSEIGSALQALPGQQAKAAQLGPAPQYNAPQATAASGTAAQGSAASGTASTYNAATGTAALGSSAPQITAASSQAAQGQAALARAAQMAAAQGGYAQAGNTGISTAADAAWQQQQAQLARTLQTQANGGGVSPADLQLQQGEQANVANQLAVLGSQRGSTNAALAQRSAADQASAAGAQLNQQMGVQRAQETLNAQNALGSVLGTARGQAQNLNLNQAQLNQQTALANTANAQAAQMQNAQFQQAAATQNLTAAQQTALANQGAQNQMTALNVGDLQQSNLANAQLAQQANEYNATNDQNLLLQNLGASNQFGLANLSAENTAAGANAQAENSMTGMNLNAAQQTALANLTAQNQFGLNNVNNAQAMNLANLSTQEQQQLANQQLQGQYGLQQGQFTQQANLYNNQEYFNELNALMGAQTGIAQSNRSAAQTYEQMGLQQSEAANQINAGISNNNSQAGANLLGTLFSGGGAALASVLPFLLSDQNLKTGIVGGNPMMDSFLRQVAVFGGGGGSPSFSMQTPGAPNFAMAQAPNIGAAVKSGFDIGNAIAKNKKDSKDAPSAPGESAPPGNPPAGMGWPDAWSDANKLGQGASWPTEPQGVQNSDDMDTMLFDAPSYGADTVPYTPVSEEGDLEGLSDDNEKEAVTSGNRGMQAFLSQQNAQQNAQNTQGSYSNAFMQTGQAPTNQVDRPMPQPNVNMGYGAQAPTYSPFFGGQNLMGSNTMGGTYGGGVTDAGGYNGGGLGGAGSFTGASTSGPTYAPGGMNFMAPITGGTMNAGGMSSYGYVPNQVAKWDNPAAVDNAQDYGGGLYQEYPRQPAAPPQPSVSQLQQQQNHQFAQYVNSRGLLSDEDQKKDKKPSTNEIADMLDQLHAYSYQYKNPNMPGAGPGRRMGIMAQDLEKSPLGSHFVSETPQGKMVDYGKMASTTLASQAYLNERVNNLEGLLKQLTAGRAA